MSKPTAKASKSQNKPQRARKKKSRVSVMAVVLGLATLLGGIASALTFLPRVTVNVSDPVNPDDPFSSSIKITNTGYIPIDSVIPYLGLGEIGYSSPTDQSPTSPLPANRRYIYQPHIHLDKWGIHDLGLDEEITIAINELWNVKAPLAFADIAVVVDYTIPLFRIQREKIFPMVAKRQTNGKFYWYSKPVS